jgi:LPXTG-motif cell wall-anchored protein
LLLGSTCHIEETRTGGATDTAITDADGNEVSDVTIDSLTEALQLDVTNTFDVGKVKVHKVVKGDGSGPFEVRLQCTYDVDGKETAVDIPGGADRTLTTRNHLTTVYEDLPTGAECTLKETENGGADSTTIRPNDGDPSVGTVTVGDRSTVSLEVVNTFEHHGTGPGHHGNQPGTQSGGLPGTGADRWTTYLGIAGAIAVLVGLGLVLVSRRRRSVQ